ncbi:MAG: hypothetical protein NVSMB17_19200 [Candidatus Dormibacteria bacterium]
MPTLSFNRKLRSGTALVLALGIAGCGVASGSSPSSAPSSLNYQLHMTFFSHESGLPKVIDPQVFVTTSGSPAGVGPQKISHAAGVSPAPMDGAADTPLVAADGTPLNLTLGAWEAATGTVSLSCSNGSETAQNHLAHLVPRGAYSVFVVHFKVNGPGRFTPYGAADGSGNNFSAKASGQADPLFTAPSCLGHDQGLVVVWHSDGMPHGASPGQIGVTWHNHLIVPIPS